MRILIACLIVLAPLVASAQPATGSADGSAATGAATAGSAATGSADSGSAVAPTPTPTPAPAAPTAQQLRETCAAAMNADPTFAEDIVKSINEDTYRQHARAAEAIKKNEKHVVYAYAAFWVLAALFVVFLWRRQQGLKAEIAQLRRDLDAASK